MTQINKPTVRVTTDSYRVLYQKARQIVVILDREKVGFREKGRRQVYWLNIDDAMRIAVRAEAARVRSEKKARKA